MPQNVALPLARQVKVRMVSQIKHRIFISGRRIFDSQGVPTQGVAHGRSKRAGKAFFPIFAHISKLDSVLYLFSRPHHFVETANSTMKSIVAVVLRDGISLTIKLDAAMRNAIRVAADYASEMRRLRHILLDGIATQHYVVEFSVPIRGAQGSDDPSVGDDADFDFAIHQRIEIDRRSFRRMPERLFSNSSLR